MNNWKFCKFYILNEIYQHESEQDTQSSKFAIGPISHVLEVKFELVILSDENSSIWTG